MKLSDFDPRRQPESLRRIMVCILAAAFIWCCAANMGSAVSEFLIQDLPLHMGIALLLCLLLMLTGSLVTGASQQKNASDLAEHYAMRGFCTEMSNTLNATPFPCEKDMVLRMFITVMMGQSEDAAAQFKKIPTAALSERQFAMLMTSKALMYIQTGEFPKVTKIFKLYQERLDTAYENEPHFFGQFQPFADDRLTYFMLAAAYFMLIQKPEQAQIYCEKARLQTEHRPAAEAAAYQSLCGLQMLYAAGNPIAAREAEAALLQAISALPASVSTGEKINLRWAAEAAKLYLPARLGAEFTAYPERNLPVL